MPKSLQSCVLCPSEVQFMRLTFTSVLTACNYMRRSIRNFNIPPPRAIVMTNHDLPKGLGSRKQVNILKNNTTLLSFKDMFRHP